jgi:hypothetical protein
MSLKKSVSIIALFFSLPVFAQKVDSIFFHLYTDSLKKGRHNYINVDGKLSNGAWMPMTTKQIQLSSNSDCVFEGNSLVIPEAFREEKIKIKAVLKTDPAISKEIIVWIKKIPDPAHLPTKAEVLKNECR